MNPVLAGGILRSVGEIADDLFTSDKERLDAENELHRIGLGYATIEAETKKVAAEVIKVEAGSDNWLAANWRPIVMLTFAGLIVARWFGWAAPNLTEVEYLKLWSIVEFGLGGYVVGRSAEKIASTVGEALKKKTKQDE